MFIVQYLLNWIKFLKINDKINAVDRSWMATFECRLSTTRGLLNKLFDCVVVLVFLLLTRRWRITIVSGRSADHYAGRRESIIVQSATWSSVGARSVRRRQHARTHCGQGAPILAFFLFHFFSSHPPLPPHVHTGWIVWRSSGYLARARQLYVGVGGRGVCGRRGVGLLSAQILQTSTGSCRHVLSCSGTDMCCFFLKKKKLSKNYFIFSKKANKLARRVMGASFATKMVFVFCPLLLFLSLLLKGKKLIFSKFLFFSKKGFGCKSSCSRI